MLVLDVVVADPGAVVGVRPVPTGLEQRANLRNLFRRRRQHRDILAEPPHVELNPGVQQGVGRSYRRRRSQVSLEQRIRLLEVSR